MPPTVPPTAAPARLPSPPAAALFAAVAVTAAAAPAPARQAGNPGDLDRPRVFLVDRTAERQLKLAERALGDGRAGDAVALARLSLDRGADGVLADGRPVSAAAADLLNGLTDEQREEWELAAGAGAAAAFDEARTAGDRAALAEVAARYPGTAAGVRAAAAVADGDLDRGAFAAAARRFADLSALPFPPAADRDRWRVKRAAALARAGRAGEARASLESLPTDRLAAAADRLLGSNTGPGTADELLARFGGPPVAGPGADWRLAGRTPRRLPAAPAVPAPAAVNLVGGPAWRADALAAVPPNPLDGGPADLLRGLRVDRAASGLSPRPAPRPLAVGGAVFAVTPAGVTARDAATGAVLWEAPAGADSALALAAGNEAPQNVSAVDRGTTKTGTRMLVEEFAFRDRAAGSLAADADRVYVLQNLDLPKLSAAQARDSVGGVRGGLIRRPLMNPARRDRANRLRAVDRRTGRLLWAVGGPAGARGGELAGGFFLAPPLPTDLGLAVPYERGGVTFVLTLDPATGAARRAVPLAVPAAPRYDPPAWRTAGLHLAEAAGLWVVPTAAGGAAAVDALSGRLAWTYRYDGTTVDDDSPRGGGLGRFGLGGSAAFGRSEEPGWDGAAPKVAAGRVLLTPADSDRLHCLSLADGAELWTRDRGAAREVAAVLGGVAAAPGDGGAVDEKREEHRHHEEHPFAVLVGDDGVRAVSLADGADLWFTPLPPAAGAAVVAGGALVVPLADGTLAAVRTDGSGVAVRVDAGGAAGNLVAAGGRLVSQTAGGLFAFATAAELEARLDSANAGPDARLLRAGLAAQAGDPAAAVDELVAAAGSGGPGGTTAAAKLRTLLARGLRRDFPTYRPLLDRAAPALGGPPAGELARALAAGSADAGEPAEAFRVLADLRDEPDETRPDRAGRFVAADAFAGPRLPGLFADAADERESLAADVTARAAALDAEDAAATVRFARRFGSLCGSRAWRDAGEDDPVTAALLAAADAAGDAGEPAAAERLLLWAAGRDPAAVPDTRFAALYEAAGSAAAAAHFAPGADPPWARRAIVAEAAGTGPRLYADAVVPVEAWPRWGVGGRLTVGAAEAELRWRTPDAATAFTHPVRGRVGGRTNRAAFAGHLLFAATAGRLLALDTLSAPGDAKELWSSRLAGARGGRGGLFLVPGGGAGALSSANAGAETRDGPAAVGPRRVVVRDGNALVARDPLSGDVLWTRAGVPPGAAAWGDGRVVLVAAAGEKVRRFRAADGESLPPVDPPAGGVWLRRGSRAWTLAGDPFAEAGDAGELVLRCVDLAPADPDNPAAPPSRDDAGDPAEVWRRSFPAGARVRLGDACTEVAVLEPSGRLAVIDVETGEDALAATVPLAEPAGAVWVPRSPGGWDVLVAGRPPDAGRRRFGGGGAGEPPPVAAYGLADARPGRAGAHPGPPAEPVWSRPADADPGDAWQPPAFPLLTLAGVRLGRRPDGRPARRAVLRVLDRRTGAAVLDRDDLASANPVAWAVGPEPWALDRAALRTRGETFAFTLADDPPGPPVRRERQDPAADSAPDPAGES